MDANSFIIPIGTSDPVDLCYGLPLFPGLGAARAGISASSRRYTIIDTAVTIGVTRLNVSVFAIFGFGFCGPALGFLSRNVNVLRTNNDDQGELTLTFNEGLVMSAGFFAGAYAGAGVTLSLQLYLPQPWYKLWAVAWRDAFAFNKDFKLDLLRMLFALIQYLLGRSSLKNVFIEDPNDRLKKFQPVRTYSLQDREGSLTGVEPNLTATPKLTLPLNVANFFPDLKLINDALAKIGGEISVGPSIALQFPVTMNFDKFTVVGGLQGAKTADYGNVKYDGNRVSASGNTLFDLDVTPSRVTSHVAYKTTSFNLALSFHFRVTVAKFLTIPVNSPSLDLTYLLYGIPASARTVMANNPVSTDVKGGCVLTPNMTLIFTGANGSGTNFVTGEEVTGAITLPEYQSSSAATVALEIEPEVADFPTSVTIPAGSQKASFNFTFRNRCLATGNREDPSEIAPPSPPSPQLTYTVRATLKSPSNNPCSDYEVELPISITERVLHCDRWSGTPPGATAPAWDPLASATMKADIDVVERGVECRYAWCTVWFPFRGNEHRVAVPVTITLLDENRQPYAGSDTSVVTERGQVEALRPSATVTLTLTESYHPEVMSFQFRWLSKGPPTGYSNRFYLMVDAGCQYGQTEFWLDVFNWS